MSEPTEEDEKIADLEQEILSLREKNRRLQGDFWKVKRIVDSVLSDHPTSG